MKSRVAYLGIFAALAMIFGYIETIIPVSIGVPGVKLGIANIVTVVVLYLFGFKAAATVSVVRIVVTGFLFANAFSIIYSLSGAVFSLFAMAFLRKRDSFSIFGVSMAGGVAHNIGQMVMALILMETLSLWYYMPVLLVSGVVTGLFVGFVANEMFARISHIKRLV